MGDARQLSRISLRQDSVLSFRLSPLPEPPEEMMKLPGVSKWFEQLRIMRERDIKAISDVVMHLRSSENA
jgi:hypothetical protein